MFVHSLFFSPGKILPPSLFQDTVGSRVFERDIFGQVGFAYRPFANRPEKSSGWIFGESQRNRKQPVFTCR